VAAVVVEEEAEEEQEETLPLTTLASTKRLSTMTLPPIIVI